MPWAAGLALTMVAVAPATARIAWEAPLECPDATWLEQRVDAYLGRPLAEASEVEIEIAGMVRRRGASFELELTTTIEGTPTQQRLDHHDCAALVELGASLAAISIDPLALGPVAAPAPARPSVPMPVVRASVAIQVPHSRVRPPAKVVEPEVESEGESKQLEPTEPPPIEPLPVELFATPEGERDRDGPRPPGDADLRMVIEASGGLALNLFPNLAPDVRAGVGLERAWSGSRVLLRADLIGDVIPGGRFRSADGSAGGDMLAWDVGVRPCAVPRWGVVDLRVCAAIAGGQLRARGVGIEPALTRAHPWAWAGLDLGLAVSVQTHVALVLDLGGQASFARPHFEVSSPDASYVTPIWAGRARLGVEFRFF